jgi:hypothetical protein
MKRNLESQSCKILGILGILILTVSCSTLDRTNPNDAYGINYDDGSEEFSSSSWSSSSDGNNLYVSSSSRSSSSEEVSPEPGEDESEKSSSSSEQISYYSSSSQKFFSDCTVDNCVLWTADLDTYPNLQVYTPDLQACLKANPGNYTWNTYYLSPCMASTGGYWGWYGFNNNGSVSPSKNNTGALALIDDADGSIYYNGNIQNNALHANFSAGLAPDELNGWSGAGIGFAWRTPEVNAWDNLQIRTSDISDFNGICLIYSYTGDALQVILQWDTDLYGYDTYRYNLETGTNKTINLAWEDFVSAENTHPLSTATMYAKELHIELGNTSTKEAKQASFDLFKLGWYGGCG